MYSLGSRVAVGSWFFISVTSKVRKSFAVIAADCPVPELELPLIGVGKAPDTPAMDSALA